MKKLILTDYLAILFGELLKIHKDAYGSEPIREVFASLTLMNRKV